jgi:hypothetical protein
MAKKSFAWNFPRPKQWQKKAWLKFSSTQNVARMTLEWLGFESPTRTRCTLRDLQIHHAGPMASPGDGDGLPVMP